MKITKIIKPISIEDQDLEWFYSELKRCALKVPAQAKEDEFVELVREYRKALSFNTARVKAFTKVLLQ